MEEPNRVALVFSGGPAPGANAVIAAAVSAFRRSGVSVLGIQNGYSALATKSAPLTPGEDYFVFEDHHLHGLRNDRGIIIGTARTNPGKGIKGPADLVDPQKTVALRRVIDHLRALHVGALVSIGGDDTLKTANFLYRIQEGEASRVRVVHVPKTIDNDYRGIDFTFGFFTAVDVMAKELLNLRADARATKSYFIVETMGRKAGWLAYGVAVAGEAHLVVGVEDVVGSLAVEGPSGETRLSIDELVGRIVRLIEAREAKGKHYGTIVLAEGLAELVPTSITGDLGRDEHGHLSLGKLDLGKLVAKLVGDRFLEKHGRTKKVTGVQLGYEARCAAPHAFDVMLGSQLGLGAFKAISERGLDGHMVSTRGQLDHAFVPFAELIDPATLTTEVRLVGAGSDFQRLAHDLGTRLSSS